MDTCMWKLTKLEFSNMLSYEDDNVITFIDNEIIGLRKFGKTALIDIICYCLFHKCTRAKYMLNVTKNNFSCKAYLTINKSEYIISKTKEKKHNAIVEFIGLNDGKEVSLTKKTKKLTLRLISAYIGSFDDFININTVGYYDWTPMTMLDNKNNYYARNGLITQRIVDRVNTTLKSIVELPIELKKGKLCTDYPMSYTDSVTVDICFKIYMMEHSTNNIFIIHDVLSKMGGGAVEKVNGLFTKLKGINKTTLVIYHEDRFDGYMDTIFHLSSDKTNSKIVKNIN